MYLKCKFIFHSHLFNADTGTAEENKIRYFFLGHREQTLLTQTGIQCYIRVERSNSVHRRGWRWQCCFTGSSSQETWCFAFSCQAIGNAMYINPFEGLKYLSPRRSITSRKFKANQAKPKLVWSNNDHKLNGKLE